MIFILTFSPSIKTSIVAPLLSMVLRKKCTNNELSNIDNYKGYFGIVWPWQLITGFGGIQVVMGQSDMLSLL